MRRYEKEIRTFPVGEITLRRLEPEKEDAPVVRMAGGLGIPVGKISRDLGGFREVISPTAITPEVIERSDIAVLFGHDPNKVLGRINSRTARMWQESDGWHYEFSIPDTTYGRDVEVLLERRDLTGSSFGFTIDWSDREATEWTEMEDGTMLRTVNRIHELFDISPVAFPAYGSDTSVALRSLANLKKGKGFVPHAPIVDFLNKYR